MTGSELDQHFGWPVYEPVEEVNRYSGPLTAGLIATVGERKYADHNR